MLKLKPGDTVYPLHYEGEGQYRFWYKGGVYSDAVSSDDPRPDPASAERSIEVVQRPSWTWWAKIRNAKGRVGWTNQPQKFGNTDACG